MAISSATSSVQCHREFQGSRIHGGGLLVRSHYTFSSMFPNFRRLYVDLWPLPRRHAEPLAPCTDTQLAEIIAGLKSHLEQKEGPGVSIIATRCHIGGEGVFRSIRGL
jgi:hypothetical protein